MDAEALLAYALALAAITAAPGPLLALLIARAIGRDVRGAVAFAVGLGVGDLAAVLAICAGLGAWAAGAPALLLGLKWAGAAYLLWVAAALWTAQPLPTATPETGRAGLAPAALAGALTCLGNPQTMLLYLTLLPGVLALDDLRTIDVAGVLLATAVATLGVFGAAICLAARLRGALAAPRSARVCNRALAVVTAAAAAWILAG